MILTPDQRQVKALLTETITLLCKNGLHFHSEFSIEGLIGITLDQEDVFLINIKETIKCDKVTNHSKAEQSKRTSPPLQSGQHCRTNESNSSEASINPSHNHTIAASVFLDDAVSNKADPTDVKVELSARGLNEHSRPVFENSDFSLPLIASNNLVNPVIDRGVSDAYVASEDVHLQDMCEPLSKRLCRNTASINESKLANELSNHHEDSTLDSKVCKSEPLDVVEIPDDDIESSVNSENSYLMYLSMYGNGGDGGIPSDTGYSMQYDLPQMNQNSLPSCSSWNSAMRTVNFNNQDKVELIEGSSVYISTSLYQELEQDVNPKGSRLVRRLVHEIFPDERTLASSSCLGKRQSCSRGLDQTKVDAIKEYVLQRSPEMNHSDFVQTINIMCADARKAIRTRYHRQLLAEHCRSKP